MRKLPLVLVGLLVLVGCNAPITPAESPGEPELPASTPVETPGEPAEEASPALPPVPEGDGLDYDYSFNYDGAVGVIDFDPDSSDSELIERVEALPEAEGTDLLWVLTDVDNTDGASDINMYQIVVIDQDGNTFETESAGDLVSTMNDAVEDRPAEEYNEYIDLSNEMATFIRPRAKGQSLHYFPMPDPLPSIAAVYVYPAGGFDDVPAAPIQ